MISSSRASFFSHPVPPGVKSIRTVRHPAVVCFREDNLSSSSSRDLIMRELLRGSSVSDPAGDDCCGQFQRFQAKMAAIFTSSSNNNRGSGNNNDDGNNNRRGWRDHDDNSESGAKHSSLVAVRVLLTFSALHLGYCITAWMRKDGNKLGIEFYGIGLGLVCFLATAAVFVSLGLSNDKFLGMWTCLAAAIATGEKWFVRKHGRLSGFVVLFGISSLATLCL